MSLRARRVAALISAYPVSTALANELSPVNLIVSRSTYTGVASTVTVGQPLPGGGNAVADGTYPNVWNNETPDPSFGVTSPIFLDQYSISGGSVLLVNSTPSPTSMAVTSFSSKSELGMSLSTDRKYLTFMGYVSTTN